MVGAVKVRKGLHEAIPLLAKWAEAHRTKILYDVVGLFDSTVEYCAQVKCLAEKYKSEFFAVVFHGHVDVETKKELIKEAVCYLHLERVTDDDVEVEGFGISIIEAASYGVPAIVAHGSATAEAVSDGKSGYMINLQNQDDFDQALTRVIEKKSLTKPEILAWADIHSTSNIFKQIDSIYKSL
jgi:glycosyltransferase involved in cell wall biosynthesis